MSPARRRLQRHSALCVALCYIMSPHCLCVRENVIELQRSHMEEMEAASQLLREELRRKEAEYEERLLQVRQQHNDKLRSDHQNHVLTCRAQSSGEFCLLSDIMGLMSGFMS